MKLVLEIEVPGVSQSKADEAQEAIQSILEETFSPRTVSVEVVRERVAV